jgi:thiopurine S-methyltransferase
MEIDFWKQRWQENQIGFHLDQVNPSLEQFFPALKLTQGAQVFVPMCGKSLDMLWLANVGYGVTGVECSELAIQSFFTEHKLPCTRSLDHALQSYKSKNIHLLHGDFFDLQTDMLSSVAAVYDRAALIALPPDMRKSYVEKLFDVLPQHAGILLITLVYDQTLMAGPPFSVPEIEVQNLYGERFTIRTLQQTNVLHEQPRFAQRGLDSLLETVYLLSPKHLTQP